MDCVMLPQGWTWQAETRGRLVLMSPDKVVFATLFEDDEDMRALEELALVCEGVLPDTEQAWQRAVACAAAHVRACMLCEMEQALITNDVDDDWLVEHACAARTLNGIACGPAEVACSVANNARGALSLIHCLPLERILRRFALTSDGDVNDRVRQAMFEETCRA